METGKTLKVIAVILLILSAVVFIWGAKDWILNKLNVDLSKFGDFLVLPNFSSNLGSQGGEGGVINNSSGSSEDDRRFDNLPDGIAKENVSYFYGKVSISVSAVSENVSFLKNPSSIRLNFSLKEGEAANITGWKIQGNRGALFVSKAVEYLDPRNENGEREIIIKGSERVNIYSSLSAVGKNFQTNKCIGYITRVNDFVPSLGGSCYSIPRKDYDFLAGSCQDLINSYNGRCVDPFSGSLSNYANEECRQILKRFRYQSCYEEHYREKDFLLGEWYIWTGQNILDSRHDKIRLYDRDDKFVDEYIY